MSLNTDMKMIRSLNRLDLMFSPSLSRFFFRMDNDWNAGNILHSNSIAPLSIPTASGQDEHCLSFYIWFLHFSVALGLSVLTHTFGFRLFDRLSTLIVFPMGLVMYFRNSVIIVRFLCRGVKKTICRGLLFSFLPGFVPLPNWIETSTKFSCEICFPFQLCRISVCSIISELIVITVSHIPWVTYGFLVFQAVSSGFAAVLFHYSSEKSLALSCANSLSNSDFAVTFVLSWSWWRTMFVLGFNPHPIFVHFCHWWDCWSAHTIFLDTIVRIRFFTTIGSLFSCEQFVTVLEFFCVIMNSFTKRFVSLDVTAWDVFAGLAINGIATSVPYPSRIFTAPRRGISEQTWKVCSRHGGVIVPHPWSSIRSNFDFFHDFNTMLEVSSLTHCVSCFSFLVSGLHFVGCRIPILFLEREKNFHTTSLPTPTQECRMSLRDFHRVILNFLGIRNTILIILFPFNVIEHWHENDSVLELFGLDWIFSLSLQVFSGSHEEQTMMKIQGKISIRIQIVSLSDPLYLGETNAISVLTLNFSIFLLLLGCLSSVQHTELNQHRHTLLLSPISSLDHEITLILPIREMHFQSYSHSESFQKVPLPIFEWCWTNFHSLRILCSCRFPNSSSNSAQDGWPLPSTKTFC